MGLSWQQGPLAPGAVGRFLVRDPLPERMIFAEPLRRRMRVRFGGAWIADTEDHVLLHEPGRYPVAYFPLGDVAGGALEPGEDTLVLELASNRYAIYKTVFDARRKLRAALAANGYIGDDFRGVHERLARTRSVPAD
jgi:hypothetical protein